MCVYFYQILEKDVDDHRLLVFSIEENGRWLCQSLTSIDARYFLCHGLLYKFIIHFPINYMNPSAPFLYGLEFITK